MIEPRYLGVTLPDTNPNVQDIDINGYPLSYQNVRTNDYWLIKLSQPDLDSETGFLLAKLTLPACQLSLNLQPYYTLDGLSGSPQRHPALYARAFSRYVFEYFHSREVNINSFMARWYLGRSRNSREYLEAVGNGLSRNIAAERTWTGQRIARDILDFRCITVSHDRADESIICLFRKFEEWIM